MTRAISSILILGLIGSTEAGQYGRRRAAAPGSTSSPAPLKSLVVTFHGSVKKVSKKEILIESDDNQLLTMRCNRKTKFTNDDGDIKPTDIDLESRVAVDASEDNDLKLMALSVKVESTPKKALGK